MNTIQVLRAESARLKSLAAKIDKLIAEMDEESATTDSAQSSAPPTKGDAGPGTDWAVLSQSDAIERVLRDTGKRMHRKQIFEALTSRGVKVAKPAYLGTILSRDSRFKTAGKRGYWTLADQQAAGIT